MYKLHHFYLKFLYCLELISAILKGSGINSFFFSQFYYDVKCSFKTDFMSYTNINIIFIVPSNFIS